VREEQADVVVIGAGHNSLIAACYLAAAGLEVLVLEDRAIIGGNTVTEALTLPGFAHDSCSSAHVLLQSNPLIRDDELGLLAAGLRYVHHDPAMVLAGRDAEQSIVMWRDRARTVGELARWSRRDGEAYATLLADWEAGLKAAHARWNAGALDPQGSSTDARYEETRRRSALDVIIERFEHDRVRDFLGWLSFLTIQPIDRPGTGILPFAITAGREQFGWATPVGGSIALPLALERHLERHGGRVETGQCVTEIVVEAGRAAAVRTASGERFGARRAVLSSAHLAHVAGMVRGIETPAELRAAAAAWRPGLSLFAVHLALRGQLSYRTGAGELRSVAGGVGGADGVLAQLAAFGRGETFTADPWVLMVCSTIADPDRAPDGQGTAKLLTIAPHGLRGGRDWAAEKGRYAQRLVDRVASTVGGMSATDVLAAVAEGPEDLERRNRHNLGGSCHGGEVLGDDGSVLPGWPDHRLPVPGLYQTGATAHPGGSVSGRPGRNTARVVLADLGLDWSRVMGPD
jgi:phytoene dehydrogenase-like protein